MRYALFLCGILFAYTTLSARAEPWLLTIAVDKYEDPKIPSLACPGRDATRLREALMNRGGLLPDRVLTMTSSEAEDRPTLANLRKLVPDFLSKPKADDTVIVFYSGHGESQGGKTLLLPHDTDLKNLAGTCYSANELRAALEMCQASTKLLVFDCCHAGGNQDQAALGKQLQIDGGGVTFIGSCTAKQKSIEFLKIGHGIFTYWLTNGISGAADADGDGQITADELYAYTAERVGRMARESFRKDQTPVRQIGVDVKLNPLIRLQAQTIDSACQMLAQQIHDEFQQRKIRATGVVEFGVKVGASAKLSQATLPKYCTYRVEAALRELSDDGTAYEVKTQKDMLPLLGSVKAEDVFAKKVGPKGAKLEAFVTATLNVTPAGIVINCEVIDVLSGETLLRPTGLAKNNSGPLNVPMTEDLAAATGRSFNNQKRPEGSPSSSAVLKHIFDEDMINPLNDPQNFPFEMRLVDATTGKELPLGEDGKNGVVVGVRKGQKLQIVVKNTSIERLGVHLLVDGLNWRNKKRELPGHGSLFVLEDKLPKTIRGFIAGPRGADGIAPVETFLVTDAIDSVAGRLGFEDQIGTITATVYAESGKGRLGIGTGSTEKRHFGTTAFNQGRLVGVINLRFTDEKELK